MKNSFSSTRNSGEGNIGNFADVFHLLHQTREFFEISDRRYRLTLDNTSRFMVPRFKSRWGIDKNLYTQSINNQRYFLGKILENKKSLYRQLKRGNIVEKVLHKAGKNYGEQR